MIDVAEVGRRPAAMTLPSTSTSVGRACARRRWSRRCRAGAARRPRPSTAIGMRQAALGAAVLLADDDVLRDVHQTTGQVARVGGPQRGVGQTLAGTVRGDEVLQHGQALAEVRLDRARDDLALRVGHQTTHAGDLADLHPVTAGARGDHHVDGVRRRGKFSSIALATSLVAWVQISMSSWRRSSSVIRPRSYWRLDLRGASPRTARGSPALAGGVTTSEIDDRDAGAGGPVEAGLLERVQRRGDLDLRVALGEVVDDAPRAPSCRPRVSTNG